MAVRVTSRGKRELQALAGLERRLKPAVEATEREARNGHEEARRLMRDPERRDPGHEPRRDDPRREAGVEADGRRRARHGARQGDGHVAGGGLRLRRAGQARREHVQAEPRHDLDPLARLPDGVAVGADHHVVSIGIERSNVESRALAGVERVVVEEHVGPVAELHRRSGALLALAAQPQAVRDDAGALGGARVRPASLRPRASQPAAGARAACRGRSGGPAGGTRS